MLQDKTYHNPRTILSSKKLYMRYFLMPLMAAFFSLNLMAQMGTGPRQGMGGMGQSGRFYGKIVDANTGKGMDATSVQLISTKFDPVTKQRKDTIINGMLTQPNGDFALENVPFMGDYKLKISAIGYLEQEQKISFLTPEMQKKIADAFMAARQAAATDSSKAGAPLPQANPMEIIRKALGNDMSKLMSLADKDLGNIKIAADPKLLENVTVTGTRSMTLAVDRKIFNVDKNLTASGGTATDIMRQIPSVNVDIDGNVTVRNSTPTIFVDGRPTTLTLEQIPSDAIQSVELITNPSAKYDASGGAASILNIVMKKNRKSGYNGSVRAGIDSRGKPNFGGDFNIRQGKVNSFVSGMLGTRKSISNSDIVTNYFPSGNYPASAITQDVHNVSSGYFTFIRAGLDYFLDNRNTLTLSGNFARGVFNNDEENRMQYDTFYTPVTTEYGYRKTLAEGFFRNFGGTLSYKHLFAKPGHEWTADVNLNSSKSENDADFYNQSYNPDSSPKGNAQKQQTDGSSHSTFWVIQTDYSNPITDKIKIDAGLRGQIRDFSSENLNYLYSDITNGFVLDPRASSNYSYTDEVFAAYATVTGKAGKLGYNVGLRFESSNYNGSRKNLVGPDSTFEVTYPVSTFPSAFLSYKLNDKSDLQLNYTRRINRPNFFQLIPFVDYTDPLNLRVGNPGLVPEFTNSIELNYSYQVNNNHNLLLSAYFKNTNDLITGYQFKGVNIISKDSAIYNTFINANSSNRYGFEITSRDAITKKFDITTNLNFYNASINSENIKNGQDNKQLSFFGKMTLTQKIGKTNQWTIQANGDYQSKTVIPISTGGGGRGGFFGASQAAGSNGYLNPSYGVDLSVRRDIIKNKNGQGYQAFLTLSMNDVFRTRIYDVYTTSDFFTQSLKRRRDPQVLRLQFNWRFGKVDTNLFKRKNMKGEMEGASEGMSGVQ
jgi:outer membrane receptor protein involved in Fe transport